MAVITISRGSYSKGKEVAEKVAKKLGYDCISRDILLDASERFNIPEIKLQWAIHEAPSILDRFSHGKEMYVTYIQSALLKYLREDNIVYYGLAGHFFVKDVPHVLKVRIIADIEDRVKIEMEREKVSYEEALRILKKDDEQRKKWGLHLYGIDTSDPSLYDLLVHIKKLTTDDAADIICSTVARPCFQTTPESRKMLNDAALSAEVKAALIELDINVSVSADNGKVYITSKAHPDHMKEMAQRLEETAKTVAGVKKAEVQIRAVSMYSK
ncbi:MAG: cytidylate kinase family protein [Desulfococcaceae bacterium]